MPIPADQAEERGQGARPGRSWTTLVGTQCGTQRSPRSSFRGRPVGAAPERVAAPLDAGAIAVGLLHRLCTPPCLARPATDGLLPERSGTSSPTPTPTPTHSRAAAAARHAGLGARRVGGLDRDSLNPTTADGGGDLDQRATDCWVAIGGASLGAATSAHGGKDRGRNCGPPPSGYLFDGRTLTTRGHQRRW